MHLNEMQIKFNYNLHIFSILILTKYVALCGAENIVHLPELGAIRASISQTAWSKSYITQFLGIPYAEPPSGHLRFKPPVPKEKWSNALEATEYGRPCPSQRSPKAVENQNNTVDLEDCLSLCIYTKSLEENNTVVVFIHGDGKAMEKVSIFSPNYMLEQNVVLVTVQYRLGLFGFASTNSDDIPGNVGVLDVILALQWIHKYIAYFGGNPNNIVLLGQGTGAALSSLLMISPYTQELNLFHKAILHSGNILAPWAVETNPVKRATEVCEALCSSRCNNTSLINSCLTNATVGELVKHSNEANSRITFGDASGLLPDYPRKLIDSVQNRVALLSGTTKHDGSFLLKALMEQIGPKQEDIDARELISMIVKKHCTFDLDSSGIIEAISARAFFRAKDLPQMDMERMLPAFQDMISTCFVKASTLNFFKLYTKQSSQNGFLFTFDYNNNKEDKEDNNAKEDVFASFVDNGDDMVYLFPQPENDNLNDRDLAFADRYVKLWVEFAETGALSLNTDDDVDRNWTFFNLTLKIPYVHVDAEISISKNYEDELFLSNSMDNGGSIALISKNWIQFLFAPFIAQILSFNLIN